MFDWEKPAKKKEEKTSRSSGLNNIISNNEQKN
jgi:hypothetical protein